MSSKIEYLMNSIEMIGSSAGGCAGRGPFSKVLGEVLGEVLARC